MWNGEWEKEAIDINNGSVTNYRNEDYYSFADFLAITFSSAYLC